MTQLNFIFSYMRIIILIVSLLLYVVLSISASAQTRHQFQAGFSLTPELVSDGNSLVIGYGFTFDYNINKNIGIETGVFPRAYKKSFRVTNGG